MAGCHESYKILCLLYQQLWKHIKRDFYIHKTGYPVPVTNVNYLNLSGPSENMSSFAVGLLRRVAALMLATKIISSTRPTSKFICV